MLGIKESRIPKGWFAYDCGQSPLHFLWYVQLVKFDELIDENNDNPSMVFVEEKDTFAEALDLAIKEVRKL